MVVRMMDSVMGVSGIGSGNTKCCIKGKFTSLYTPKNLWEIEAHEFTDFAIAVNRALMRCKAGSVNKEPLIVPTFWFSAF